MPIPTERILKAAAWLAAASVVGMISIFFATGVGQDPLQFVHAPDDYRAILLQNPQALRATLGLDNLFIVLYSTVFLCQAVLLGKRPFVVASGALLGVAGVLDMVENFHFMAMLGQAELGISPSTAEISFQVWESLLKFHVSYLGLFLLAFALPRRTFQERLLANLCAFVQLPVGILIYVTPRAVSVPLVFVRFSFFLAGLFLIASIFGGGSDAPAKSPGTTQGVSG